MPNIASVLKEEITRLARKEVRSQTSTLKRVSAQYRRDIAKLKRQLSDLQHKVVPLQKQAIKSTPTLATAAEEHVRFSAKGLRAQRNRLDLSQEKYAKLVGVTAQTIYSWESGMSRPRKSQLASIASVRHIGKREAQDRLEQVKKGKGKRKSK